MPFSLFDVVLLVEDIPNKKLKSGMIGVVIDIYTAPSPAYEVEFYDDDGKTITQLALPSEMLKLRKWSIQKQLIYATFDDFFQTILFQMFTVGSMVKKEKLGKMQ